MDAPRFYVTSGEKTILSYWRIFPVSILSFLQWGFLTPDPNLRTKDLGDDAKSVLENKGGFDRKKDPYLLTALVLEYGEQTLQPFWTLFSYFACVSWISANAFLNWIKF